MRTNLKKNIRMLPPITSLLGQKNSMFSIRLFTFKKSSKKIFLYKLLIINVFGFLLRKTFKKTSQNIWSVLKKPVPLHSQIRNNAYHTNKNGDAKALKMSAKHDL